MKKLSAYTVASNCTDLTDIRDGIAEIHEAMKTKDVFRISKQPKITRNIQA